MWVNWDYSRYIFSWIGYKLVHTGGSILYPILLYMLVDSECFVVDIGTPIWDVCYEPQIVSYCLSVGVSWTMWLGDWMRLGLGRWLELPSCSEHSCGRPMLSRWRFQIHILTPLEPLWWEMLKEKCDDHSTVGIGIRTVWQVKLGV